MITIPASRIERSSAASGGLLLPTLTPRCYLCISRSTSITLKFGPSWVFRLMALVPPNPAAGLVEEEETVCTKEHCFRCFDALFCALTGHKAIAPQFPDEK